jgi:putative colanic acid biosynthesis acetyltransferase WcaF
VQLSEPIAPVLTRAPGFASRLGRLIFVVVWFIFARASPAPFHAWRAMLLRFFGAKIDEGAAIYSSAIIWAPWNLVMERGACLARGATCYSVAKITLKRGSIVSQGAHLCSASHDIRAPGFPLTSAPIVIGEGAWVAAEAFVGPGVTIGDQAVLGARGVAIKSIPPRAIAAGNPASIVGVRDASTPRSK